DLAQQSLAAGPAGVSQTGVARARTAQAQPDLGFKQLFDRLGSHLAMSLTATADGITTKVALVGSDLPSGASAGRGSLAELPAQAWLAWRLGKLSLNRGLSKGLAPLPAAARGEIEDALRAIREQTGVDVERDLLSWMGDASVLVSGDSPA